MDEGIAEKDEEAQSLKQKSSSHHQAEQKPEPDIFNDQEWDTDLEDESKFCQISEGGRGEGFRHYFKVLNEGKRVQVQSVRVVRMLERCWHFSWLSHEFDYDKILVGYDRFTLSTCSA